MFYKKRYSEKFHKIHRKKKLCSGALFNKDADLSLQRY